MANLLLNFLDRIKAITAKKEESENSVEQTILAYKATFRLLSALIYGMRD